MSRPKRVSNRMKRVINANRRHEAYLDAIHKESPPLYCIVKEEQESWFEPILNGLVVLLFPVMFGLATLIFGV